MRCLAELCNEDAWGWVTIEVEDRGYTVPLCQDHLERFRDPAAAFSVSNLRSGGGAPYGAGP